MQQRGTPTLFDIAACRCADMSLCNCEKENKAPHAERAFLLDQRSRRKMMIGVLDIAVTHTCEKKGRKATYGKRTT